MARAAVARHRRLQSLDLGTEDEVLRSQDVVVRTGGDKEASDKLYADMRPMTAGDLADLFWWLATLPPHLNINTIEMMPVKQSFAGFAVAREG